MKRIFIQEFYLNITLCKFINLVTYFVVKNIVYMVNKNRNN